MMADTDGGKRFDVLMARARHLIALLDRARQNPPRPEP
jgi:hypothetical protein